MNNIKIKKIYAISLFFILGILMTTSPSLRIYAADEEGSSGDSGAGGDSGGSNDSGGDNDGGGSKNNGDSGDGGDGETKQGTSNNDEGSKQEADDNGEVSNNNPDDNGDNSNEQPTNDIDREKLKGTAEEQEQAAIEDYIHEEPGIVKPYPYVPKDKPKWGTGNEIPKLNLLCSHTKEGCNGGQGPNDGPTTKGKGDGWGGDGWKKGGDKGDGKGDWCKHHKCGKDGHDDDDHKHHHNWCDSHNCHHHNHHTSTHFSDNHKGHVTVKIELDYKEKNSKNLDDVELLIGDVYDKTLNLSDKPDTIKVDHLDIDGGDDFAICLANEDTQEGSCTVAEADNDHDTITVELRVL
jgi:hypothetical protein